MPEAFTRILVATDFGAGSGLALDYARMLAGRFGAGLRVVHVVETPTPGGSELFLEEATADAARALREAQERLAETMRDVTGEDVVGQVLVGHAPRKIVEYAVDHGIDLIVMGTHGRRAFAHLVMGSVAERVIRSAPCPVFTVRDDESRTAAAAAAS